MNWYKLAEQMELGLFPDEEKPALPTPPSPPPKPKDFPPIKGEKMPFYPASLQSGRIKDISPVHALNANQAKALLFKFNPKLLDMKDDIIAIMDKKLWNQECQNKIDAKIAEEKRQKDREDFLQNEAWWNK